MGHNAGCLEKLYCYTKEHVYGPLGYRSFPDLAVLVSSSRFHKVLERKLINLKLDESKFLSTCCSLVQS